jgi:lytic murein transglycosylase
MVLIQILLVTLWRSPARAETAPEPSFQTFIAGLWPQAQQRGVSREFFTAAFEGMSADETVIAKSRRQPEFTRTIQDYLASAVSPTRIETGKARAAAHRELLASIEARHGVDRHILLAIWGMETNFGGFTGNTPVLRALATLAYSGYRGDYFQRELIGALQILQEGHVSPEAFKGSWAGAMGQTQFMPSSFRAYAVDFDGDGRKDIWSNVADALGSSANYLARHGWDKEIGWGFEVAAPPGATATFKADVAPFGAFSRFGVMRANGAPLPLVGEGMLIAPAGERGPAFLVTKNFKVIRTYNNALAYALGVSLLADRIAGVAPLHRPWPTAQASR